MKLKSNVSSLSYLFKILCISTFLFLLAGCSGDDNKNDNASNNSENNVDNTNNQQNVSENTGNSDSNKNTVIIGTTDSLTDLDPANAYDFITMELLRNIGSSILELTPGTTEVIPGLAKEKPVVSSDGKEFTFKLRQGLTFSDGSSFNANAVKFSIDRVIGLDSDPAWLVYDFVKSVEVIDNDTVKFILNEPVAYFSSVLANSVYIPVSSDTYSADSIISKETDPTKLMGLGPYNIESVTKEGDRYSEVKLKANSNYYGQSPKTENIVIKYFSNTSDEQRDAAEKMYSAFKSKEIDIAWRTLNPEMINEIKEDDNYKLEKIDGAVVRYLSFRSHLPPFNDVKLRQAIAASVDRESILLKVFGDSAKPLYSMIPMGMWSHVDSFKDSYGTQNIDKAKQLLTESGFGPENKLEMELWYTDTHYGNTEADFAEELKSDIEETGMINVTIKHTEWAEYLGNFNPEDGSEPKMMAFLLGWYPDYIDPDNYVTLFGKSGPSKNVGIYFNDEHMDELLTNASIESDYDERITLYKEIQNYWAEKIPTLPLSQEVLYMGAQKNIVAGPMGTSMHFNYGNVEKK